MARLQELMQGLASLGPEVLSHLQASSQGVRGDGGSFVYLFEMPEDSLLYQDTSRHWSGTLAQFVARHADLLRPRRVILDHHGDWLPGFSLPTRITPIREAMARAVARTELVELDYLSSYPLFEGLR